MTNHHCVLSATLTTCLLWTALLAATPASAQVSLVADLHSGDGGDRIDAALARRISGDFVDTPLRDVIQYAAKQTGITIRLSKKIEDAGVQPDQPITISTRDIPAESFLSLVLRDLNLTLMVKLDAVLVTTVEDAQSPENMITRIYLVADLIDLVRLPASQGGGVAMDFDPIIELITSTVEPDSWQDVGGPGSISGFENSRSLVISNRRDIHHRIAATIVTLRRAKGLQGIRASQPLADPSPRSTGKLKLSEPLPVPSRQKPATLRMRSAPELTAPAYGGGGLF